MLIKGKFSPNSAISYIIVRNMNKLELCFTGGANLTFESRPPKNSRSNVKIQKLNQSKGYYWSFEFRHLLSSVLQADANAEIAPMEACRLLKKSVTE
jgi:hypothetical protein